MDCGGSQVDTFPDTISAVAIVLGSFLNTGSIHQLVLSYLWNFNGLFQQSVDGFIQLVIGSLSFMLPIEKFLLACSLRVILC